MCVTIMWLSNVHMFWLLCRKSVKLLSLEVEGLNSNRLLCCSTGIGWDSAIFFSSTNVSLQHENHYFRMDSFVLGKKSATSWVLSAHRNWFIFLWKSSFNYPYLTGQDGSLRKQSPRIGQPPYWAVCISTDAPNDCLPCIGMWTNGNTSFWTTYFAVNSLRRPAILACLALDKDGVGSLLVLFPWQWQGILCQKFLSGLFSEAWNHLMRTLHSLSDLEIKMINQTLERKKWTLTAFSFHLSNSIQLSYLIIRLFALVYPHRLWIPLGQWLCSEFFVNDG